MPLVGRELARFVLAGDTIGGATLSRFFAFHVFFIPAVVFGFVGLHLMLVLRHGISEPPKLGEPVDPATYRERYKALLKREGVPFWPDAAWRDVVFGAAVVATVVLLALIVGPPELGKPPDPSILEAYPRPDWYFLWYFALLAYTPQHLETAVIVLAPLLFGATLLLMPVFNKGERSLRRRPWAGIIVVVSWTVIIGFWSAGVRADWSPNFNAPPIRADTLLRDTSSVVERGAQLFHEKGCEFCHAINGVGGRRGPELTHVATNLTPDQMTSRITNGGPNMPAFVRILTPKETAAIVAFLSRLQ
jgi:ubiquinol-cytochrome c reductase cytochrome b subunit